MTQRAEARACAIDFLLRSSSDKFDNELRTRLTLIEILRSILSKQAGEVKGSARCQTYSPLSTENASQVLSSKKTLRGPAPPHTITSLPSHVTARGQLRIVGIFRGSREVHVATLITSIVPKLKVARKTQLINNDWVTHGS